MEQALINLPRHLIPGSKLDKICACGKKHSTIPSKICVYDEEGSVWGIGWKCDCGSDMFVPAFKIKREAA